MNPRMLVLDEPTAMLDPDARIEVMRILDMLQRRGTRSCWSRIIMTRPCTPDRVLA
mgnify:CR=1 FL=1